MYCKLKMVKIFTSGITAFDNEIPFKSFSYYVLSPWMLCKNFVVFCTSFRHLKNFSYHLTCKFISYCIYFIFCFSVLRKHGKLITFLRSFILARPSRRGLKQRGILRERVFGCDLGEHLLNSGQESECNIYIQSGKCFEQTGYYKTSWFCRQFDFKNFAEGPDSQN